ncbi:TPA: hypothetical protein JD824_RS06215 [Citrobacter freundii]|uniref:glycine-rich domain-containing protein n=1 Tax=Citrobacter freundii TaxID=546 RepID=UPI0020238E04|nr:hypothetical protein [Citrobacter freundii]MCY3449934.1 hypothetical protein [Citrobacter freundii]HCD1227727.1 hypothetical protein [Citrobacter freundii]HDT6513482.1 hypothetical protein [Citrobacter freundii]HEE9963819.1 hypothetical protein [Citrobacter freundii]HEE9979279.1 hypothetical protein [Citrobacter freundii]
MFHLDNNSGVSAMPPVGAVQSSAPRWYTEGGGGTPASYPGADWYNIIQAELLNLLSAYGINPNKSDFNQLQHAIEEAISQNATANSALLTAIAALVTSANKMPYFTGKDKVAMTDLTAFARTLLGRSDAAGVLSDLGLGDGSGRLINVKTFTASGTYTPSAGMKFIIAEVLGGGGGGGSNAATPSAGAAAGAGGASGAYAICRDTNRGPLPVVIGAAGSGAGAAVNGANGNPGGTSSIGSVSAPGGNGGPAGTAFNVFPTGGNVASGSGSPSGNIIVGTAGAPGSYGILYSDSNATGGGGANSIYGAGGAALTINAGGSGTAAGAHAQGHGAGGGGAVSVHAANAASSPGGNGSPGIVIVWEYA